MSSSSYLACHVLRADKVRTFCAVVVTACVHLHSYRCAKSFIVIQFGSVPTRSHQETVRTADFLCAAAPPHQRHRVLLALLTPLSCLKTVIDLVAHAPTTRYNDKLQPDHSPEHAAVPWVAQPAGSHNLHRPRANVQLFPGAQVCLSAH